MLGGNLYDVNIDYGRYDAGYGLLLKGAKGLKFMPQSIGQSGLVVKGESRDMVKLKTPKGRLLIIGKRNAPWQVLKMKQ